MTPARNSRPLDRRSRIRPSSFSLRTSSPPISGAFLSSLHGCSDDSVDSFWFGHACVPRRLRGSGNSWPPSMHRPANDRDRRGADDRVGVIDGPPRRDKQEISTLMAANTPSIETTAATKLMRDARGDARPVVDRADDGRLLRKIFAKRPAIAILASDSSQER